MTWNFRPLKWLVWGISGLVFMASTLGSFNYARIGVFDQLAFILIEESHTVRPNPVFDAAKHAISLAVGAVRILEFAILWDVANISVQGFLGAFAEFACLVMPFFPISILIVLPMVAGTLAMYRVSIAKISSLVPAVYSDCSRPDRWPKMNGLELFSVYGGNVTAMLAPQSGCESLKWLEYWGLAGRLVP